LHLNTKIAGNLKTVNTSEEFRFAEKNTHATFSGTTNHEKMPVVFGFLFCNGGAAL